MLSAATPVSSKMACLLSAKEAASSPLSKASGANPAFQAEFNFFNYMKHALEPVDRCLRLYERANAINDNAAYVVFNENAVEVSKFLFASTSALQYPFGAESNAPICAVNGANHLSQVLREFLLERDGWRVEFWAWDGLRKAFRCTKRASPGNIEAVESLMLEQDGMDLSGSSAASVNPVIAAAWPVLGEGGEWSFALAWCDLTCFSLGLLSFVDNSLLTTFESALIQLGVRELLVPNNNLYDVGKVRQVTEASSIALQQMKAGEYFGAEESGSVEGDLARLTGLERFKLPELSAAAAKCVRCLLTYGSIMHADGNIGSFRMVQHNLSEYVRLDEAALSSLSMFPKQRGPANSAINNVRSFSLFGLLDQCKTSAGSRTLNQWLRQPLQTRAVIENRLDLVELWMECGQSRQRMREVVLRGVGDVSRLIKKVLRARSSLQEVVQLYQVVAKLHQVLQDVDGDAFAELKGHGRYGVLERALLGPLRQLTAQLNPFVQMIEETLDFEALARNEFCVRSDFDAQLQALSREKQALLAAMDPEFQRVCREMRLEPGKKCKLETNAMYGHYLRISRLDAGRLAALAPGRKRAAPTDSSEADTEQSEGEGEDAGAKGYAELAAIRSGIFFVTPRLRELSNRYAGLGEAYAEVQGTLVQALIGTTQQYRAAFDAAGALLAMLDVVLAVAHVAASSARRYCRPCFREDAEAFELVGARHPCIEVQPQVSFIPNDVRFSRRAGTLFMITGPNMGGKSTFIRQTALIAIMAQCGFFVPCERATLPLFDCVLVRVGAGDNLMRGISTFMAEMLETATILRVCARARAARHSPL